MPPCSSPISNAALPAAIANEYLEYSVELGSGGGLVGYMHLSCGVVYSPC